MKRRKSRCCRLLCCENTFKPTTKIIDSVESVSIMPDEFEAIILCDLENYNQIEAGKKMQISRATIQRLLKVGRQKIVDALLNSKEINIKRAKKGEKMTHTLRVALPTTDGINVDEHFGHCKKFFIYNVVDSNIESKEEVTPPAHTPGSLPKFLGDQNADVIITGGMGAMAINLFKEQNIDVILGASGNIDENLAKYLGDNLESTGSACNHDHDEHSCSH